MIVNVKQLVNLGTHIRECKKCGLIFCVNPMKENLCPRCKE